MTPNRLDILKEGLSKFSKTVKDRKDKLNAKLSRKEPISSADEQWLDYEANTVDEQRILDDLEAASDYERGLAQLDEAGKGIVKKLREWAGDLAKVAGKKRKRMRFSSLKMFVIDAFLSIKAWSTKSNVKNLKRSPFRHQLRFSRRKRMPR